jgi:MFS family permease
MESTQVQQKKGGLFYGWWVLFACVIGQLVGPAQFAFGSLGMFIIPLHDEFGWSRSEISLAATVFTLSLTICMPIVGKFVDRFGSKRVLLPAMLVIGLSLGILPIVLSKLWHLLFIFFLMGTLGAAANSLPFMMAISSWFDKWRGLAIGMTMAGSGLGYAAVPPLLEFVNSKYGWHYGYFVLAAIILFFAIPIVVLLFCNKPAEMGLLADGKIEVTKNEAESTRIETGFSRYQAIHSLNFWVLVLIFALLAFCLFGLLIHIVPMLVDRGMTSQSAAKVAGLVGITILCVRIPIGFFMDRFFAPHVALVCFLLSAVGMLIFAFGAAGTFVYIAAVLVGFSIGAEIDLLAFMAGRYFGLKNFGQIYGLLFSSMMLGVSLGPVAFGYCFDTTGNYTAILYVGCGLLIAASLVTLRLSEYPDLDNIE